MSCGLITAFSDTGCGRFTESLSVAGKKLGSSLSIEENDALVMFNVLICGATDSAPLLSKNFREALASEPDDMPKSRRHDDPPLLFESILKLDVDEIFLEKYKAHDARRARKQPKAKYKE
ncbi:MAG: hypothetical protein Q9195_007097 [Heterodermia aff. obscurata]